MSEKCEIRWCGKETDNPVYVNENIGDGTWRTPICQECADKIGIEAGDDLPDARTVREPLKSTW